ncbi:MAG: tRNA 2-thiouridine(34) synthase MnmA [Candidatus Omnitrophica bacterium]|nr:tRNA 2-thiouridine(34) synthase MnmA [Candidatus Omnitrophota bacterium]
MMNNIKNKKVFVAMSGGVDSSVAAALLKTQGYDVEGITMCFNVHYPGSKKPSCCGADGIQDARQAAKILGISHHVLDFEADLKNFVVDDFVKEYLAGRTPNPCVRCNQLLKFGSLLKVAAESGADYLATGHYAKVIYTDGAYELQKADDSLKDQSYFLYGIKKEFLPKILFPLGDKRKDEVRELARHYQLNTAEKKESQDICFVSDGGYQAFVEEIVGKDTFVPGDFVNEQGKVVGKHKGIAHYTIGQREKLGIALGFPVYVFKIDKVTNTVHVGRQDNLYARGLLASQLNWLAEEFPKEILEVQARIRYNAREVKASLMYLTGDKVKIEFKEPQKSVTPGQSVVFYDRDIVLGGAVIDEAIL